MFAIMESRKTLENLGAFLVAAAAIAFFVWAMHFIFLTLLQAYSWTTSILDDDGTVTTGEGIAGASESATKGHVAYCNSTQGKIRYITITSGVTSTFETIIDKDTPCASSARDLDVVLDGANVPVIAFVGGGANDGVFFTTRDGAGAGNADDTDWTFGQVTTTISNHLSLAVTSTRYGIAWQNNGASLTYATCTSSCTTTVNWTIETVDASAANVGRGTDIVFDFNNQPVISYTNVTDSKLKYAIRNGAGSGNCTDTDWNCYIVDAAHVTNPGTGVDVDQNGKIGIAYQDDNANELTFAYQDAGNTGCTGGATTFTCEQASSTASRFQTLRFQGVNPMIAWNTISGANGDLAFSVKQNGSWSSEVIEDGTKTGRFASIDNVGSVVGVVYWDETNTRAMSAGATVSLNNTPSVTALTVATSTNGTGSVTIRTAVSDSDANNVKLKVQYKSGSTCTIAGAATTTVGAVAASSGSPTIDNNDASGYQVQGITTASANTVTTTWASATDVPTGNGTFCVFITPNDGTIDGTTVSTTVVIDNVAPTAPGALTVNTTSTVSVILAYGAASTETNFNDYRIYYKAGSSGVTQSDTAFTTSSSPGDSNLSSRTYNSAATTTVTGLATSTQYVFNIWAHDTYGNRTTSSPELVFYTLADTPGTPTLTASTTTALHIVVATSTNPSGTTYSICGTTNGTTCTASTYVQTNGTLGSSAAWATYSTWGGDSGASITGLTQNTQYTFMVIGRNGDNVQTATSTTSSPKYTLAAVPVSASASANSDTKITASWGANSNPSGTEYYVSVSGSAATNSGWITSTSYQFTGLTCNTTYTFTVKARNGDSTETTTASANGTTNACTSAAPPPPPPTPPPPADPDASAEEKTDEEKVVENPKEEEEEEIQCFPTGLLYPVKSIGGGQSFGSEVKKYTNTLNIGLKMDTAYAEEVYLHETPDMPNDQFAEVEAFYQPVPANAAWSLEPGTDGIRYINAKFRTAPSGFKSGFEQTTWACVVLDTVPPAAPVIGSVNNGIVAGAVVAKPSISGTAESDATIILTKQQKSRINTDAEPEEEPKEETTDASPNRYWTMNEGTGCILKETNGKNIGSLDPGCALRNAPKWVSGVEGTGLRFDGIDDMVSVAKDPAISFGITDFSVSVWMKTTAKNIEQGVASKYDGALGTGWVLSVVEGYVQSCYHFGNTLCNNGAGFFQKRTFIADGAWHHIAVTFDRNGSMLLYIDGVKAGERTQFSVFANQSIDVASAFRIGASYGVANPVKYFSGDIDEVRLFGSVLSASAVVDLYERHKGALAGMAAAPSAKLAAAGKVTFTTSANSGGNWSFAFPDYFDPGEYDITATAEDKAGNLSGQSKTSITVDEQAPEETEEATEEEAPCDPATDTCDDALSEEETEEEAEEEVEEVFEEEIEEDTEEIEEIFDVEEELIDEEIASEEEEALTDTESEIFEDIFSGEGVDLEDILSSDPVQAIFSFSEQAVSSTKAFILPFLPGIAQAAEFVGKTAAQTAAAVQQVVNNPEVEAVNETVVAPTAIIAAAANAAVGFQIPQAIAFLRYLFGQPLLLLTRRKRKRWGVVYNAYTKAPIDLATVRILDAGTKKIIRSQVTDAQGRYFLMLEPGKYMIEVDKSGFGNASELLRGKTEDAAFSHLYHPGQVLSIPEHRSELNVNIPLDPKETRDVSATSLIRRHVWKGAQHVASTAGLVVSIGSFVISPTIVIGGLIIVHLVFYLFFHLFTRRPLPNTVGIIRKETTGEHIGRVVVRVFDAAYNKLINTMVTDKKGRYGALVGPSVYYVTYEKPSFQRKKSPPIDLSEHKTRGLGGVIARDMRLRELRAGEEDVMVEEAPGTWFLPKKESIKREIPKDPSTFDFQQLKEFAEYGKVDEDPKGGET